MVGDRFQEALFTARVEDAAEYQTDNSIRRTASKRWALGMFLKNHENQIEDAARGAAGTLPLRSNFPHSTHAPFKQRIIDIQTT